MRSTSGAGCAMPSPRRGQASRRARRIWRRSIWRFMPNWRAIISRCARKTRSSNCSTRRSRTTRKALELTQNLYNGGAAALTDVAQAQAQLETARTQAADIRLQRAQSEHAIAVLLGQNPSAFHMDANPLAVSAAPPPIDPGLPSSLLERRPDVAAAERRTAAANAQIGVARAAYFPVFSLAAAAGFDSTSASNWLTAPSQLWSAGTGSRHFDRIRRRPASCANRSGESGLR